MRLVHTVCPLCGADQGEPVAVGSDACGSSRETYLALGCPVCGLVYLNPRPAPEVWTGLYPPGYFARRERSGEQIAAAAVRRLVRQLNPRPPAARVLEVGYGPRLLLASRRDLVPADWSLEAVTPHSATADGTAISGLSVRRGEVQALEHVESGYDLVVLFRALEHWDYPVDGLTRVGRLLRAEGRVLVLTPNPESTVARVFRGRHWTGYDFPRHPCLFGAAALRRLAESAGLENERLGTRYDSDSSAESAASFQRDWEAPGWLVRAAPGLLALAGGTASLPWPGRRQDAGAWLEAVLRKREVAA
jgi:SAM-dependent methyltransferase